MLNWIECYFCIISCVKCIGINASMYIVNIKYWCYQFRHNIYPRLSKSDCTRCWPRYVWHSSPRSSSNTCPSHSQGHKLKWKVPIKVDTVFPIILGLHVAPVPHCWPCGSQGSTLSPIPPLLGARRGECRSRSGIRFGLRSDRPRLASPTSPPLGCKCGFGQIILIDSIFVTFHLKWTHNLKSV